jgi:hypothetical protein
MNRTLFPIFSATIFAATLAGCASQIGSEAQNSASLAKTEFNARFSNPSADASVQAELRGETAAAYGDDQIAVKMFERSYSERPSVLNEFNLAAAYARTGRPSEAIGLYRKVAFSGTTEKATTESLVSRNGYETSSYLATEARRRMIRLQTASIRADQDAAAMTAAQPVQAYSDTQPH